MFVKYRSLENHYNFEAPIELMNEPVIIREKIDGSNFSIVVEKDGSYRFASRNQLVSDDWHRLKELAGASIIEKLSKIAESMNAEINLYGEVFDNTINRRIKYGNETRIVLFDCLFDGQYLAFPSFVKLLEDIGAAHLMPVTEIMPLKKALQIDVETFKSRYADEEAEGIVIIGHDLPQTIAVKKKSQRFLDKSISKIQHEVPEDVMEKRELVYSYICNENRVKDYFSKIEAFDKKKMGEHIKAIQEDGFQDCLKDNPEIAEYLEENKRTLIKATGSVVSRLLITEDMLAQVLRTAIGSTDLEQIKNG